MYKYICEKFIDNYKDVSSSVVRERFGIVFSVISILLNTVMVLMKLLIAFITHSVSIMADGFNNLSDVASNIATLVGFRLSNKHADADHPYGHGRYEYIASLIIAALILFVGFSAMKDSILKIINGNELLFKNEAVVVLLLSIGLKLLMASINKRAGEDIDSDALRAAGQDSLNDSIMTFSTLICLLIYRLFNINVDAYVAVVVSVFVLKSGFEIAGDVLDTILGKAPDKELIDEITSFVVGHNDVLGVHDLILHDYGPSNRFMSLHAEVSRHRDIMETHDMIDNLEGEIYLKYGIITSIHMDPIDDLDERNTFLKNTVSEVVREINPLYSIHDFRSVSGPTHTNLIFDLLLPPGDLCDHKELKMEVMKRVNEKLKDNTYYCVILVEHSFV